MVERQHLEVVVVYHVQVVLVVSGTWKDSPGYRFAAHVDDRLVAANDDQTGVQLDDGAEQRDFRGYDCFALTVELQ